MSAEQSADVPYTATQPQSAYQHPPNDATHEQGNNEVSTEAPHPASIPLPPGTTSRVSEDALAASEGPKSESGGDSSSNDSSSSSSTERSGVPGSDYKVKAASHLTREDLFRAHVEKLGRRHRRRRAPGMAKPNRGPRLIDSVVDYVQSLESRIQDLESKVLADTEEDAQEIPSSNVPRETGLEIGFFDVRNEVCSRGLWKLEREMMTGTYRSLHRSPRQFIRALYRWKKEPSLPLNEADSTPNPQDIEILGIRIDSAYMAPLFGRLTYDNRPILDTVIESYRPFKLILGSLVGFREELAKLEHESGSIENAILQASGPSHPEENDSQKQSSNAPKAEAPEALASIESEPSAFKNLGFIRQINAYLEFIEKYLEPKISLYNAVQNGTCSKIAFENLWMLFERDDVIYCPAKRAYEVLLSAPGPPGSKIYATTALYKSQAYRIIYADGGALSASSDFPDKQFEANIWAIRSENAQSQDLQKGQRDAFEDVRDHFCELRVYCFYVNCDAGHYSATHEFFEFKPYQGELEITNLEAYPLRFHSKEDLTETLLIRGRRFVDMTRISHMNYEGHTAGRDREEVNSPVVVDLKLFYQENPSLAPNRGPIPYLTVHRRAGRFMESPLAKPCKHGACNRWLCLFDPVMRGPRLFELNAFLKKHLFEYDPEDTDEETSLEAIKKHLESVDLMMLLPGTVPGFVLRNRKWVTLDIDLLKDVDESAGWKDLVLSPGHKDIVQAMVENHAAGAISYKDGATQRPDVDIVKGKGKGCIILIHGAPGVGKTSTAECVAAHTKRPLFPITCGDIGYQPEQVESSLDRLFRLAHKWNCVLLLDEADVFLAKRNKEDIKRNGLVSIFLRILEYYSGILFLTTNRVGTIDDAFRSRLHLTLYYPPLDRDKTRKVWKVNMKRLKNINKDREKAGRLPVQIEKRKILQYAEENFAELHWNGRQIRNAFQSALALADFKVRNKKGKSPVISVEQFHTIATASQEFDQYLHATHGADEEKMAQTDKVRGVYKKTESRKLKIPMSDDSESSSASEEDKGVSPSASRSDDSGSGSDSEGSSGSEHKKGKKKKTKRKSSTKKKDKKAARKEEESGTKKKKGSKEKQKKKKKAEDSDSDSESDD